MNSKLRVVFASAGLALFARSVSGGVPPCTYDIVVSGSVNSSDLAILLGAWGQNPGHPADFTGDGEIDSDDLALLLGQWGPCPQCDAAADCDDQNPCTQDACTGGQCAHSPISPCCGNGVVESGEQCDPPNGTNCNTSCQIGPLNNICSAAIVITDGDTPFSTLYATTDGPVLTPCDPGPFGDDQVHFDVWYNYTAMCTGNVVVTTCNQANFDTRLASYSGCSCPVNPASVLACNDDDPASACGDDPDFHSTIVFPVSTGNCYKIRVGGFGGKTGTGTLSVFCGVIGPCSPGNGSCCVAHGSPGCEDVDCCQSVCALDPFCCNTQWDSTCVGEAQATAECNCGVSDCCVEHPYPGCDDPVCESDVCSSDPFCCDTQWDALCAQSALQLCTVCL